MKKKNLFESKFLTSLRNRKTILIKENDIDALADNLEKELEQPSEPTNTEDANLEAGLSEENPEVADIQ